MSMAAPQKYMCGGVGGWCPGWFLLKDLQMVVTRGLLKSWHMLPEKPDWKGRLCLSIHGAGRGDQLGAGLALFMWKLYIKYGGVETVGSREIVRGR